MLCPELFPRKWKIFKGVRFPLLSKNLKLQWFLICIIFSYILSLAVADLLVIITTVPLTSVIYVFNSWPWGSFLCTLSEFIKDVSIGVSVFTLCALSGDRFFAIVDPLRKFHHSAGKKTTKVTVSIALSIWLLACICGIPAIRGSYIKVRLFFIDFPSLKSSNFDSTGHRDIKNSIIWCVLSLPRRMGQNLRPKYCDGEIFNLLCDPAINNSNILHSDSPTFDTFNKHHARGNARERHTTGEIF